MTDLSKIDNLEFGDLILVCQERGIKVTKGDDAASLRVKLAPKPKR